MIETNLARLGTLTWINEHLPEVCCFCGGAIAPTTGFRGVSYFVHPECYWRHVSPGRVPFFAGQRDIKTNPIRTPGLNCLSGVHKVELSDGCAHGCIYCYTYSEPRVTLPRGLVILRDNLAEKVKEQLRRMKFVKPIYLSPNCDPFQRPLKKTASTTKQLVEIFIENGLSFYFVTKGVISQEVLDLIHGYPYVDVQLTLIGLNDEKRKLTEPNAPSVSERLKNIEKLVEVGIHPIQRIDPLLPFVTDDESELKELLATTIDLGVRHVVGSYIGMRKRIWSYMRNFFEAVDMDELIPKYERLFFGERRPPTVCHFILAPEKYRYSKLKRLSEMTKKIGDGKVTYSTCLEDTSGNNLFNELWTSTMCEPISLPTFRKEQGKFKPVNYKTCNLMDCAKCSYLEPLQIGKRRNADLTPKC